MSNNIFLDKNFKMLMIAVFKFFNMKDYMKNEIYNGTIGIACGPHLIHQFNNQIFLLYF